VCAPDLEAISAAYAGFLDYIVCDRGEITAAQAAAWDCREMQGAPTITMRPAGGDDFQFRFVQRPPDPDYEPLTTWGWNASELIVADVDAMAARVAESPFAVVGEPRDLSFSSDIRAMQLRGPGAEIVYLTEFKKPVPGLDVPAARTAVDRTFIVIVGGASLAELQDFYHDTFDVPRAPAVESRITTLSKALKVSIETLYPIAALPIGGKCLIEADEMPAQVGPRKNIAGHLPPGIAIVTFDCAAIPAAAQRYGGNSGLPYDSSGEAAVLRGAAGELLELLPV
jgi:hypothetical protein